MNTNMPPFEDPSDARLHAHLRRLPDLQAPASLATNVLAAIRAREEAASALAQTPWYRRPATTWPPALRIALGLVGLALVAAVAAAPQLLAEGNAIQATLTQGWDKLAALFGALHALVSACGTALRGSATSPVVLGSAALIFLSYFALLGIGGAVWRTASQARHS